MKHLEFLPRYMALHTTSRSIASYVRLGWTVSADKLELRPTGHTGTEYERLLELPHTRQRAAATQLFVRYHCAVLYAAER